MTKDEYLEAENYFNEGDYDNAFKKYEVLANQGSVDSQIFLGWMYQQGIGTNQDFNEAENWYNKAASCDSAEALFYLGKLNAVRGDETSARKFYEDSAKHSYSPALFRLGWYYEFGKGIPKDINKALDYYTSASNLGHIFAKKHLAILLIKGARGFFNIFYGVLLLLQVLITGPFIGAKDPHSDIVKE